MSKHEIIPFVFAFVAGFGGLVECVANLDMREALNRLRSPHDQIPVYITSWKSWRWWFERGFFPHRGLWKEFRQHFPESRTYWWHLVGLTWMLFFFGVAAILLMLS